ncbi:unnamed protein product [Trichogramma brassicae]|uniref:Molybdenum cofactor biosynthesis protein 1 n=1 Tax=Trichogramma brassicae TaxID=86971 RepID=A0A6H5ICY4_9HYME|nr:unnamed protein product [Trichogramma brassicae]
MNEDLNCAPVNKYLMFVTVTVRLSYILVNLEEFREKLNNNKDVPILMDSFGRQHTYLRISLTERCNLRCTYCMPANGVPLTKKDKILSTDEIIQLSKYFIDEGVNKIRLTGGEPTVRKDIHEIISQLKDIRGLETLAMTTNGIALTRMLPSLQRAGLDLLNISLDTLKPERFEKFTLRRGWSKVVASIDLAIQLGYNPLKINTVIMRDFNDDELVDFVQFTKDRPVDVRFIEYMPFSGNEWNTKKMVPFLEMKKIIRKKYPEFQRLADKPNDTSKAYHVPGFKGQIGFITSMTQNFCSSCNRLRITADGNLKVCLFEGKNEISLRDALRNGCSNEELKSIIQNAVLKKKKQHAANFQTKNYKNMVPGIQSYLFSILTQLASVQQHNIRLCSSLTHVNDSGKASMVDVGNKNITHRTAQAQGFIYVGPKITKLIEENNIKKGDVLTIAQLAGILAAKKTSDLIPLCHSLLLNNVKVDLNLNKTSYTVKIRSEVKCSGKTGVEMEALTAVSIAALTVYDMCKAADLSHSMQINGIELVSKTGGQRGDYHKKFSTDNHAS